MRGALYYFDYDFLVFICSYFTANAQYTQFEHEGINRQYIYYEPLELNEQKPLVFVMHGFTGDASGIRNYSGMNQIADQYGFRCLLSKRNNRFRRKPFLECWLCISRR